MSTRIVGNGFISWNYSNMIPTSIEFQGKTVQDGTPTPLAPVAIKTNNAKWTTPLFNQINQYANFASTSGWSRITLDSFTVSSNVGTLLANAANGRIYRSLLPVGHKAIYIAKIKSTSNKVGIGYGGGLIKAHSGSDEFETLQSYVNITTSFQGVPSVIDTRASDFDEFQVKEYCVFDLTQMFGAGNEPSTIEEFNDIISKYGYNVEQYYDYNTGTPIGGTLELTTDEGALPLNGIGIVCDTYESISGKLTRVFNTQAIDNIPWEAYQNVFRVPVSALEEVGAIPTLGLMPSVLCQHYTPVAFTSWANIPNYSIGISNDGYLFIRDDRFDENEIEEFKEEEQGIDILYAMQTPIVEMLTPQLLTFANSGYNQLMQVGGDVDNTTVVIELISSRVIDHAQDAHIIDMSLLQQLEQYWKSGNYQSALNVLNNTQLNNKYLNAEVINFIQDWLVELQENDDPTFKQEKIIVSTNPPTLTSGQVWFEIN